MTATSDELVGERMWIEIIQRMEEIYAELVERHNEIERKNEELERANVELRKLQNHLVQSEKMRSLGRMAAGIAHEINNPLGAVVLYSHLVLEDTPPDDPRRENIEKIIAQASRCQQIVTNLLGFARPAIIGNKPIGLASVLDNTIDVLRDQAMFHNVRIVREVKSNLPSIYGDAGQIQQAFTNIILNAVEAMDGRGTLTLRVEPASMDGGPGVMVTISDTGKGIEPQNLKRVFEPFFTAGGTHGGMGLGLAITYAIVVRHRGQIDVESAPGQGATFRILFPVESNNSHEEAQESPRC